MGPAQKLKNAISCGIAIIALAGLPVLTGSGCASASPTAADKKARTYKHSSVKTLSSIEATRSADPIDRYAASMIFFKLDKASEALSISISAEYTADVTGTRKTRKTYFVVEKIIDMSGLNNRKDKYFYAEIGRNFDPDWNRQKELTLVSSVSEPFKNLDGNSLYRLRYTTFSTESVDFTITINADCGVTFLDDIN